MDYDLIRAAEVVPLRLLYLLAKADARGRISEEPGELEEHGELFADYGKELEIWEKSFDFANTYTRYQYFHKEEMLPGAVLYDNTEFDVWMMAGIPLAGKDTWIEKNGGGRPVISLDGIREELGVLPKDGSGKVVNLAISRASEKRAVYLECHQSDSGNTAAALRAVHRVWSQSAYDVFGGAL